MKPTTTWRLKRTFVERHIVVWIGIPPCYRSNGHLPVSEWWTGLESNQWLLILSVLYIYYSNHALRRLQAGKVFCTPVTKVVLDVCYGQVRSGCLRCLLRFYDIRRTNGRVWTSNTNAKAHLSGQLDWTSGFLENVTNPGFDLVLAKVVSCRG